MRNGENWIEVPGLLVVHWIIRVHWMMVLSVGFRFSLQACINITTPKCVFRPHRMTLVRWRFLFQMQKPMWANGNGKKKKNIMKENAEHTHKKKSGEQNGNLMHSSFVLFRHARIHECYMQFVRFSMHMMQPIRHHSHSLMLNCIFSMVSCNSTFLCPPTPPPPVHHPPTHSTSLSLSPPASLSLFYIHFHLAFSFRQPRIFLCPDNPSNILIRPYVPCQICA